METTAKSQLLAWLAISIASDAADICWQLHSGHRLPLTAELIRALMLVPLALMTQSYLRGFVVTLIAFLTGNWMQRAIEHYGMWFSQLSVSRRMYIDAWLALIPSVLIAFTLLHSRLTKKDIYLTPGNLHARFGGRGRVRWSFLAPAIGVLMVFGLTEQLRFIQGNTQASVRPSWFALSVLSLTFAAINAANEEFRFRFVLLAQGKRAVGARSALLMTSLNFGLAHYGSGHPGGPTGAISTAFFGMLLCRSLYDTEGGLWAWLMHVGSDVIIFTVVLFRVG